MRCPECSLRNSITAKKCNACGKALPRKPLPLVAKIFLGGMAGLASIFCLTALCTTMDSPEKALIRAAGEITSQSKSAEQAMNNFQRFDSAVLVLLQKFGTLDTADLRKKLAESLPKSLYEAHVFEILSGVKLVEIDTALNVADYLILQRDEKAKIFPVIGLHVYDVSSILPLNVSKPANNTKQVGQMLVLLGHTAGSSGNHPTVKVLYLANGDKQAEDIVDMTDKFVPTIYGEGSAKLAANQKDIDLALSLLSCGQDMKLFALQQNKPLPVENETLYDQLIWTGDHYDLRRQAGITKLYALYAALAVLENHHKLWFYRQYLATNVRRLVERTAPLVSETGFIIQHNKLKSATTGNIYILTDGVKKITVDLRYVPGVKKSTEAAAGKWLVDSLNISAETISLRQLINQPEPVKKKAELMPSQPITSSQQTATAPTVETKTETKAETKPEVKPEIKSEVKSEIQPETKTAAIDKTLDSTVPCHMQTIFCPDIKSSIKIRSGPGTSYRVLNQLKPGGNVAVTGRNGSWYRIDLDGKEGYVYGGFVNTTGSAKDSYRSAKSMNAGALKDENNNIVAHIFKGEHLVIVSSNDKQYKVVLVDGRIGYLDKAIIDLPVKKALVTSPAETKPSTPNPPVTNTMVTIPTATSPKAASSTITSSTIAKASAPLKRAKPHIRKHSETPPPFVP